MGRLILRIMIFCLFLMMTTSAFAAQRAIIRDGWYKIVPVHVQSKALDSAGAGKNAGTNLQIWDFVDAPQQKFYVQHRGNGWYSFKAGHCDLYVDAQGGVPRRGENVWLYTWNGTDAQLWGLYNAGDGYYIETKMQSNLVFDCAGAGRNNGNNVQLWSKENVGWHKWKFVQVSPPQLQTQPQSAEKYVVSTNGATLALRSGPGTNYGIRVRMPRGSVVEVYSISNGWANLSYNGTRGYASAQYLSKVAPGGNDRVSRALAWVESNLNRKVGTGQCVALIKAYASQLGLSNPIVSGNACDYATRPLQSGWTRVQGGTPRPGDILVYVGAKYGHVAICAGDNVSFHQNMKGKYVEKKVNWPYNNSWFSQTEKGWKRYWGYIRPNI
ncbi:MAG: RICIN domain-containing protein [Anaerovibrio sp.]